MLFKPRFILFVQLIIFSFASNADEKPIELFTVHYPPYTIIDQQNNITGIDVEVTQAAFAAVGINTQISVSPWKRIMKNIKHGRIAGTLTCSKRAERDQFITYSDQLSETHQVAVISANTNTQKLKNFADLSRFQVTVVDGWGIEQELINAHIQHTTAVDTDSGIRSVVYRGVDVFYNSELVTLYHARQLNLQDKIKIQRLTDKESTSFYLCLSKSYPGTEQLIDNFNLGLRSIKKSGEFDAIYEKYL